MNPETYDMYRKMGYTPEEAWGVMIGATETNDGIDDDFEMLEWEHMEV